MSSSNKKQHSASCILNRSKKFNMCIPSIHTAKLYSTRRLHNIQSLQAALNIQVLLKYSLLGFRGQYIDFASSAFRDNIQALPPRLSGTNNIKGYCYSYVNTIYIQHIQGKRSLLSWSLSLWFSILDFHFEIMGLAFRLIFRFSRGR